MDNEKTTPETVETTEAPVEEKKSKKGGKTAELEKKLAAKEEEIVSLTLKLLAYPEPERAEPLIVRINI